MQTFGLTRWTFKAVFLFTPALRMIAAALLVDTKDALLYNPGADICSVESFVEEIEKQKPQSRITCSGRSLPFPPDCWIALDLFGIMID